MILLQKDWALCPQEQVIFIYAEHLGAEVSSLMHAAYSSRLILLD
jgi:hypothetical protein